MTVSVRPWAEISADLRDGALYNHTRLRREAAVAGDALAAAMIEVRSERDTAIAKAALCNAKLAAVTTERDALAAEVAALKVEVDRLMVIATDQQLEAEITRALGYIPSRFFNGSDPWELAVLKMREELDEWRTLDPEQRHNRSVVEAELSALTAVVAAVHTALDRYQKDYRNPYDAARDCVSAIAEAVGR